LQKDCWIILNGKVYDATSVLAWHPGGASAITNYAGKAAAQATADYNAIHDAYAQKKTEEVLIGKLSQKGIQTLQEDQKEVEKKQVTQAEARKDYALKPFQYLPATLVKRKEINRDTRLYTFKVPDIDGKAGRLGLHIGGHIQIASHWNDAVVMR
jgi:nitrate reductase (NAD(P)H)